jgi:hypothetical protein
VSRFFVPGAGKEALAGVSGGDTVRVRHCPRQRIFTVFTVFTSELTSWHWISGFGTVLKEEIKRKICRTQAVRDVHLTYLTYLDIVLVDSGSHRASRRLKENLKDTQMISLTLLKCWK